MAGIARVLSELTTRQLFHPGSVVLPAALAAADVCVMGVPSHGFREVLSEALPHLPAGVPIVSLTKGLEQETLMRMTEGLDDTVPSVDWPAATPATPSTFGPPGMISSSTPCSE